MCTFYVGTAFWIEPMSSLTDALDRLETRIQQLVEKPVQRIFSNGRRVKDPDLTHKLVKAMQTGITTTDDGTLLAPDLFTLIVHPVQAEALEDHPTLLNDLTTALHEAGIEAGLTFLVPPAVRVVPDVNLVLGEMTIDSRQRDPNLVSTTAMEPEPEGETVLPENAFFIINGTQVFHLDRSVVNIGRDHANDLVIDDQRVSRVHAQLRVIEGSYTIFDLGSLGGTTVNNQQVSQAALQPGDVILLAGVPMVYGQEAPPGLGRTQEYDHHEDIW